MRSLITTIIATLIVATVYGSNFKLEYNAELGVIGSGGKYTPFYLMNNTSGVVSYKPNSGYLRAGIYKDFVSDKKFTYSFGIELTGGYRNDANIYLQQAYFDLHLKSWSIFVGARDEYSMLWDRELSSGSMMYSGNSRPIPQIYIGLPEFTKVPGTKGWLQVRGGIAYGWFVDYPYQKDMHGADIPYTKKLLYHRKNLIFKIGHEDKGFYGVVGIDMAAQFGGTVKNVHNNDGTSTEIVFPSGIKEYFKVFVPMQGSGDSPIVDQVNVSGNHLGIYILSLGYKKNGWDAKVYYEHYFDDHSGMIFKNKCDGLWGISLRTENKFPIEGFTFEVMNATNQSGPFLFDAISELPVQISGGDNYYGHVLYNGWTQRGHSIGTPFITSPLYNSNGNLGFTNTLSRAFHCGIDGTIIDGLRYRALVSHQRGWGTPYVPSTGIAHEFSALLEFKYAPPKLSLWQFLLSGAIDRGTLFGDNWGVKIGVKKSGILYPWRGEKKQ
ncbi:MAG: capsule assembly Wzi family protein [Bacteroidales bacterium]